jgi:dTDP-4-dehydrorhamnose reductase
MERVEGAIWGAVRMRSVLITGASGVLGWNLCRYFLGKGYEVWGTYCRNGPVLPGIRFLPLELGTRGHVSSLFKERSFYLVIHCAAMANPDECEKERDRAWRINVEGTRELLNDSNPDSLFIYVSTDLVFDGTRGWYSEDDQPSPINFYAETKLSAEELVRARPGSIVVRMAKLYSLGSPFHDDFLNWMIARFESGRRLPLFRDQYRTPVWVEDVACAFAAFDRQGARHSLYHLGGESRLNRLEFGELVADILGYDRDQIDAIEFVRSGLVARGCDCSLNSRRLFHELGFAPSPVQEALVQISRELRGAGASRS